MQQLVKKTLTATTASVWTGYAAVNGHPAVNGQCLFILLFGFGLSNFLALVNLWSYFCVKKLNYLHS